MYRLVVIVSVLFNIGKYIQASGHPVDTFEYQEIYADWRLMYEYLWTLGNVERLTVILSICFFTLDNACRQMFVKSALLVIMK